MFINHRSRQVSLRRPPGARARAEGRAEAESSQTRRFLHRSTSIEVSVHVCIYVYIYNLVNDGEWREGRVEWKILINIAHSTNI